MESDITGNEPGSACSVEMIYPPETLRPREEHKRLLSELHTYASLFLGRGNAYAHYGEGKIGDSEEHSWDLRQAIKERSDPAEPSENPPVLKWHLILHLEQELREQGLTAKEMIAGLKAQASPLEEALGEGEQAPGLFDDLSLEGIEVRRQAQHYRAVLEAWLGLFGRYLSDDTVAVTLDRWVMDYAETVFEGRWPETPGSHSGRSAPEMSPAPKGAVQLTFPKLRGSDCGDDMILQGLSGRTLLFFPTGEAG